MYINEKLHTSSRVARSRAVSKSSTLFYTPCIITIFSIFTQVKKSDVVIGKILRDIPYIQLQVHATVKTSLQNGE